jgi:hypothetical protein
MVIRFIKENPELVKAITTIAVLVAITLLSVLVIKFLGFGTIGPVAGMWDFPKRVY